MTRFIVTEHARSEMLRRGIVEDEISAVFAEPQQSEAVGPHRWVYQSRFSLGNPPRVFLLRVFVDTDRDPPEVVTVYRTSKIDKYWR